MSSIALTSKENALAHACVSTLMSYFPLAVHDVHDPALRIAALRLNMGRLNKKDQRAYQIVLCKMIALYPEESTTYFVEGSGSAAFRKIMQTSAIQKLYNVYMRKTGQMGTGFWTNRAHEAIIHALHRTEEGSLHAAVIHRDVFKSLLSVYDEQSKAFVVEEGAIAPEADDVRSLLSRDAFASSLQARKHESLDRRGQCYCCGSPKPRRVTCRVCGYTPAGSSR